MFHLEIECLKENVIKTDENILPVTRLKVCNLHLIEKPAFRFPFAAVVVPDPHEC